MVCVSNGALENDLFAALGRYLGASRPATGMTTPSVLAASAPSTLKPPTIDLRVWLPGRWKSEGGTTELTIDHGLNWEFTSTYGGRWWGSGQGEISEDQVILSGGYYGSDSVGRSIPSRSVVIKLRREAQSLAGTLEGARIWSLIFLKATD